MRVKCIDNDDMEDLLNLGQIYDVTEDSDEKKYQIIYNAKTGDLCSFYKHRFYVVSDECIDTIEDKNNTNNIDSNKTYYFFTVKIKDSDGYGNTYDGVCDSDNGLFPLRQVEEKYRNGYGNDIVIDYGSIIKISKDDYEWKMAEMSKFRDGKGD